MTMSQKHRAAQGLDRAPGAQAVQFARATKEESVHEMDAPNFLGEHLWRIVVASGRLRARPSRAPPDEAVRFGR
jgi:hypothetical protein